ncbi:hypothetical protein J4E91_008863 [Alternaria rosae]|nr:hypothetical protein J4E91_008863 [Alternaria rosae]
MSTNRCEQILAEVDNDITMAAYRIFGEAQVNENITAKDWEDFAAGLDDGNKRNALLARIWWRWWGGEETREILLRRLDVEDEARAER